MGPRNEAQVGSGAGNLVVAVRGTSIDVPTAFINHPLTRYGTANARGG